MKKPRGKGASRSVQAGQERALIMAALTRSPMSRAQLLEAVAGSRLATKFANGSTRLDSVLNGMKRRELIKRADDGTYRRGKNAAPVNAQPAGPRAIRLEVTPRLWIGGRVTPLSHEEAEELYRQLGAHLGHAQ